jgi:hypothetical protein
VLDVVAINAAIVDLRAGQFRSHLMRERPKTIQRLYEEFEKYCRSYNDFGMCMEEHSHQKKSAKANQSSEREWPNPRSASHANPRNVFGLDGKNAQEIPNPQGDSQNQTHSPPNPPHSNQGGGLRAEGAAAEAEVAAGAEAITRKENGITSSTRRMMIIVQTIAHTRKDSRISSRRKGRRRGPVP